MRNFYFLTTSHLTDPKWKRVPGPEPIEVPGHCGARLHVVSIWGVTFHSSIFWLHVGFPFHVNKTEFHGCGVSKTTQGRVAMNPLFVVVGVPPAFPCRFSRRSPLIDRFLTTFLTDSPCVLSSPLHSPPSLSASYSLQIRPLLHIHRCTLYLLKSPSVVPRPTMRNLRPPALPSLVSSTPLARSQIK